MDNSLKVIINNKSIDLFDKKEIGFDFLKSYQKHYIENSPSTIGLDAFYLGITVLLADRRILRENTVNSWTRNISIIVSVINLDLLNSNKKLIEHILSFLTGDYWEVDFIKRDLTQTEKKFTKLTNHFVKPPFYEDTIKSICMFSGGLDSYIGAIDLLHENSKNLIFCNIHSGGNSFFKNFLKCKDNLIGRFNNNCVYKSFSLTPRQGVEGTTRSRSFAFFTHALCLSTCFKNVEEIIIPENGLISLNVPLSIARYSSASTRTTHPHYLEMMNKLIKNLGFNLTLVNPYQFKTKGEMVLECRDYNFLKNTYMDTMSCSHPSTHRYQKKTTGHCGHCLPCFIRKAAELKGFGMIPSNEYYNFFDGRDSISTRLNLEYRIKEFDNLNLYVDIQKNGPLTSRLDDYVDLYRRGMAEIKELMQRPEAFKRKS